MRTLIIAICGIAAAAAALVLVGPMPAPAESSSHREAPLIAEDPSADTTDLYAFRSPDAPGYLTVIANWIPAEDPAAGPNWYRFSERARYSIKVDRNGDAKPDVTYRFRFKNREGTLFLGNTVQDYVVTRVRGDDEDVVARGVTPPNIHRPALDAELRAARPGRGHEPRGRRPGLRRPARGRVLRRHRRDLRPGRDPQGRRQRGRREGLLRRLRRPCDRAPDPDRAARRRRPHGRRLGDDGAAAPEDPLLQAERYPPLP